MKLFGQVDLKPVLVTILSGAVLGAGGFLWNKVMKVDVLEARMSRIEDMQEAILNRLPIAPVASEPVQPAGYKRPAPSKR
jgi:hypothetical protein